MIFASDLDRTLIYSRRFINEVLKDGLVPVEVHNDEVISFMTNDSLELLKEIASKIMFIPITTRTTAEYSRIDIFNKSISNKYAVTTNGGSILIDNKLDTEWDSIIKQDLRECEGIGKVVEAHKKMVKDKSVLRNRIADEKFFYDVVDEDKFDESYLDEFDEYLKKNGWNKYVQGRKIYYIPDVLTKRKALMHIMKKENIENTIVSGDSLLDLSMLEIASKGFVLLHGQLANSLNSKHRESINLTTNEGFKGTEEFLKIIKDICSTKI